MISIYYLPPFNVCSCPFKGSEIATRIMFPAVQVTQTSHINVPGAQLCENEEIKIGSIH